MKKLIYAAILLSGSFAFAHGPSATPLWGCHLDAQADCAHGISFIIDSETIMATGTMACVSATGKQYSSPVQVKIHRKGLALGIEFPGSESSITILALKAGLSTPSGMYGAYELEAGPGVDFVGMRIGANGGVEVTPGKEAAVNAQITMEGRVGLGVDFTASTMEITPIAPAQ